MYDSFNLSAGICPVMPSPDEWTPRFQQQKLQGPMQQFSDI